MTVLVVYASAHGSTRSIAERITGVLRDRGQVVELRSVHEVKDVARFDAFVMGSAIHNQAWLIEATEFAMAHRDVLARHPVWLFSVGMPAALRGPWRRFIAKEEAKVAARLRGEIGPRGHRLFSGVVRRKHISPFCVRHRGTSSMGTRDEGPWSPFPRGRTVRAEGKRISHGGIGHGLADRSSDRGHRLRADRRHHHLPQPEMTASATGRHDEPKE